ncbi:MAG TPA: hypothetical protein DHM90_06495, partial [Clostridiaceae bacterium]|nr:hypothetical protein [Clostridiaceae bacterium]
MINLVPFILLILHSATRNVALNPFGIIFFESTDALNQAVGFKPKTKLKDGLQTFTDWYVKYYRK